MVRRNCMLIAALLAWGCGEGFPPEACLALNDTELFIGETELVALCYTDPDGDVVTATATSSDPSVVEAVVQGGAGTVLLRGKDAGEAVIDVVATDSEGLAAPAQVFMVTVPNRAPEAQELPEVTLTNDAPEAMLTLPEYFSDPDGHALTFSAVVSDETAIRATVRGDVLEIAAVGSGSAIVQVTATDPHGAVASADAEVAIRVTVAILDDPFEVLADSWQRSVAAVAEIVSGRLKLQTSSSESVAVIYHTVGESTDWSITVSTEYLSDDLWPTVLIATNGDPQWIAVVVGGDIRRLTGNYGLDETNLAVGLYSENEGGWVTGPEMVGMYTQIAKDTALTIGVRIGPEALSVLVDGTQIQTQPLVIPRFNLRIPGVIRRAELGAWPAPNNDAFDTSDVTWFDWIRVTGILTGGASPAEARLVAPGRLVARRSGVWTIY